MSNPSRKNGIQSKNCKVNVISASEKGGKFNAICNMQNGSTSNATGEYIVKSDKEWTYNMVSDGVMAAGTVPGAPASKMHANIEAHARWKSSNCGSIKSVE